MRPAPFPFPRSIATVSLAGNLPEKLEAAASVGFNGVELFENDLLTFTSRETAEEQTKEPQVIVLPSCQSHHQTNTRPAPAATIQPPTR